MTCEDIFIDKLLVDVGGGLSFKAIPFSGPSESFIFRSLPRPLAIRMKRKGDNIYPW